MRDGPHAFGCATNPNSGNLALALEFIDNLLSMAHRLPRELLTELRTYLQHFDQTGHLGESTTISEIKRRLRDRIAEVEAELRMTGQSRGPSNPRTD